MPDLIDRDKVTCANYWLIVVLGPLAHIEVHKPYGQDALSIGHAGPRGQQGLDWTVYRFIAVASSLVQHPPSLFPWPFGVNDITHQALVLRICSTSTTVEVIEGKMLNKHHGFMTNCLMVQQGHLCNNEEQSVLRQ